MTLCAGGQLEKTAGLPSRRLSKYASLQTLTRHSSMLSNTRTNYRPLRNKSRRQSKRLGEFPSISSPFPSYPTEISLIIFSFWPSNYMYMGEKSVTETREQCCPGGCRRYTAVPTLWRSEIASGLGAAQSSVYGLLDDEVRYKWLCGRVPDLQPPCNREVAGSNLGRGYFAPRSTQPSIPRGRQMAPAIAWKAKAGMAHSDCG